MKRYRMVVFDWDGTLVDSTAAITEAIQGAAVDLGLARPSDAQASHVIGLGLADALRLAVPELTAEQTPAFIERYKTHYLQRDAALRPFEGIRQLLGELRGVGVALAIATGKSRVGLQRALAQTGWEPLFSGSRCADEGPPKPHPWMLDDLCRQNAIDPEEVVMVGDTTHDLQMARGAGVDGVAVLYGAHPESSLRAFGPSAVAASVDELRDWLIGRVASGALR